METYFIYDTAFGKIAMAEEAGKITQFRPVKEFNKNGTIMQETPLIKKAAAQLDAYLAGKIKDFDLPLAPKGTPFQVAVWRALLKIPYGKTCSYGDIARAINNPKAVRAVGGANNRNPIFIIIPCHRVIGADGSLTGYGGGLPMKKRLLELETKFCTDK